jgi:hypothetical protein
MLQVAQSIPLIERMFRAETNTRRVEAIAIPGMLKVNPMRPIVKGPLTYPHVLISNIGSSSSQKEHSNQCHHASKGCRCHVYS